MKKRLVDKFKAIHCMRGQVLAAEGSNAERCYLIVKGKVRVYRKLINDEVRDSNSRRAEVRNMTVG